MANLIYRTKVIKNSSNENLDGMVYAKIVPAEPLTFRQLMDYVAEHSMVYDRSVVYGVMYSMVDIMKDLLCDGQRLWLGDLGILYPSLMNKAAANESSFKASKNIIGIRLQFRQNQSKAAGLTPKSLLQNTKVIRDRRSSKMYV